MTDAESNMKRYVNAVERRLNLPREIKARVMSDFLSAISARREAGLTDEEILRELGSPKAAASELNEQMKEFAYRKSPWRFAFLILAVVSGLCLLSYYLILWYISNSIPLDSSVGIIGGADGPTSVFVATSIGLDWDQILPSISLVVGLLGFFLLSRQKPKKKSE